MMLKKIIIFPIKIYQYLISPLLGSYKCKYHPTCSQYMILAIKKKGLIKGFFLGIWRILRCNPFAKGGIDEI